MASSLGLIQTWKVFSFSRLLLSIYTLIGDSSTGERLPHVHKKDRASCGKFWKESPKSYRDNVLFLPLKVPILKLHINRNWVCPVQRLKVTASESPWGVISSYRKRVKYGSYQVHTPNFRSCSLPVSCKAKRQVLLASVFRLASL